MFFYKFPNISHIDQVLPAIEGYDGFGVYEKEGGYTVITINVNIPGMFTDVETLDDALRRECRGILFNTRTGDILSRPYHKFKNINEADETQAHLIPLYENHHLLEKLDGSMVRPFVIPDTGGLRWGTKAGVTDVSMQAELWVVTNLEYFKFARDMLELGLTPLFEWCSKKQKIVIDHPVDRLILTGIRDNYTGHYASYDKLVKMATKANIEVVQPLYEADTLIHCHTMVNHVAIQTDIEGLVVRWFNGHMVKVKCDWYMQLHNTKEALMRERHLVEMILENKVDDIMPILDAEDRWNITDYERTFWDGIALIVECLEGWWNIIESDSISRKEFALRFAPKINSLYTPFIFRKFSGCDFKEEVVKAISKNLGSNQSFEKIRGLFGNPPKWQGLLQGGTTLVEHPEPESEFAATA